jgi:hypothetical protein
VSLLESGLIIGKLSATVHDCSMKSCTVAESLHLIYCYCHGYAPAGPGVLRRDRVKRLKERIEQLNPDTPERQAWETCLGLTGKMDTQAWMYIGNAEIKEGKLNRQNFFEKRQPIVFLNMCQSAELLPSRSRGLVRVFLDHNASAVISGFPKLLKLKADEVLAKDR